MPHSTFHQARWDEPMLRELSSDKAEKYFKFESGSINLPEKLLRDELKIPEMGEVEVVRHFTRLSEQNYGVDSGIYPLGSCTMKYNPKICEEIAGDFEDIHPYQSEETVQGALELIFKLESLLCEIGGVSSVSLQPPAGAGAEFLGMTIIKKFFEDTFILTPPLKKLI